LKKPFSSRKKDKNAKTPKILGFGKKKELSFALLKV